MSSRLTSSSKEMICTWCISFRPWFDRSWIITSIFQFTGALKWLTDGLGRTSTRVVPLSLLRTLRPSFLCYARLVCGTLFWWCSFWQYLRIFHKSLTCLATHIPTWLTHRWQKLARIRSDTLRTESVIERLKERSRQESNNAELAEKLQYPMPSGFQDSFHSQQYSRISQYYFTLVHKVEVEMQSKWSSDGWGGWCALLPVVKGIQESC